MSIAHHKDAHLKRTKYKCDVCGKVDFWSESWSSYGSPLIAEERPQDILTACAPACHNTMMARIESGQYKLPELKLCGFEVRLAKKRSGY